MVEGSGAGGQLLKAAMAFACHNMAALLEARALDDLTDEACHQISLFYAEEMGISGRRFTPHSGSPTSSQLREKAASAGVSAEDVFDLEEQLQLEGGGLNDTPLNPSSANNSTGSTPSSSQKKARKNSSGSSDNEARRRSSRSPSVSSVCSESSVDSDFFDFIQVWDIAIIRERHVA